MSASLVFQLGADPCLIAHDRGLVDITPQCRGKDPGLNARAQLRPGRNLPLAVNGIWSIVVTSTGLGEMP